MEADDANCTLGHPAASGSSLSPAPELAHSFLEPAHPSVGPAARSSVLLGAGRLEVRFTNPVAGRSLDSTKITFERCYPRPEARPCRAWI